MLALQVGDDVFYHTLQEVHFLVTVAPIVVQLVVDCGRAFDDGHLSNRKQQQQQGSEVAPSKRKQVKSKLQMLTSKLLNLPCTPGSISILQQSLYLSHPIT